MPLEKTERNQIFARQHIISRNKQLRFKQTSKIFKRNSLHVIIRETAKVFLFPFFFFLIEGKSARIISDLIRSLARSVHK